MRHDNHSVPNSLPNPDHEADKSVFKRSVGKLKVRSRRNSEDTERRSSFDPGRRLSRLVHQSSKRRKSPRVGDEVLADANGDTSIDGIGSGLGISAGNGSQDSLSHRPSSITSSLLTDDDDGE